MQLLPLDSPERIELAGRWLGAERNANQGGRGVIDRLPFTFIGRQRQCHYIDGRPYDPLLYDMLATEHQEI